MSILQKIGAIVKSLMGSPKAAAVDKTDVLNNIEMLTQTAASIKTSLQSLKEIKAFGFLQQAGVKDTTADVKNLQKIYNTYFQKLPAKLQQAERDTVFSSINAAIGIIEENLVEMRENFATVFGGVENPDISAKELTISIAAALGWMENVQKYFDWIIYFIGNISAGSERIPPYQLIFITKHVEWVAAYTVILMLQTNNSDIVKDIVDMRKKGVDLHLETDGHTIDAYAVDSHYTPETLSALNGFRNPVVVVGNSVNVFRRWLYESRKAKREWLASKVGYLSLQANGLDPNSPEAIRLRALIVRYAEIVAQLDKKLEAENHA